MESEEFAVDVCRLNNFLLNNQLVQANAIVQRLESVTASSIELYRKVHMTRTYIMSGNKDEALKLVREIASTLPWKEKTE